MENKIEFNPMEHVFYRNAKDENGEIKLDEYGKPVLKMSMTAINRTAWFRSVYPKGKIKKIIRKSGFNPEKVPVVQVECRVYADQADADEDFLANGFSNKCYVAGSVMCHYLECAATAAKVRALKDAGFVLPDEDAELSEAETSNGLSDEENGSKAVFADFPEEDCNLPITAQEEENSPAPKRRPYEKPLNKAKYDPTTEMESFGMKGDDTATRTGQTMLYAGAKEPAENELTENIGYDKDPKPVSAVPGAAKPRRRSSSLLAEEPATAEEPQTVKEPESSQETSYDTVVQEEESIVEEPVAPKPEPEKKQSKATNAKKSKSNDEKADDTESKNAVDNVATAPKYDIKPMTVDEARKVVLSEIVTNEEYKGKSFDEIIHGCDEETRISFINWAATALNPDDYSEVGATEIAAARVLVKLV